MISFKNLSKKASRMIASVALVASQSLAYTAGFFISAPNLASAASTGQVPTTTVAPNDWDVNIVANVQADDFDYVTEDDGQQQGYSGFDFSAIPAGSTIDGIAVNTLAARTGSLSNGCQLQLAVSGDGGSTYSNFKTRGLTPDFSYIAVGGNTDLWGGSWTTDDLSSTDFVVKIKDYDPGTSCVGDTEIFVDHLIATVYYTPAPPVEMYDICHATNSATNPYTMNTVSEEAIDGVGGSDHFGQHTGQLAETQAQAQQLKDNQQTWGDIIPPVPNVHNGQNWSAAGQAILANDCQVSSGQPQVDFCDPSQKPGGMNIYSWLNSQDPVPDCVDYEVDISVCGEMSVALTKNETPYSYGFSYSEGSVDWNFNTNASNVTFPEDYNGGSVDVYFWGVGSEKDYFTALGYPWYEVEAEKVTVNTDCEQAEVPTTVKVRKYVDNDDGGSMTADQFNLELDGEPLELQSVGPGNSFDSIANFYEVEIEPGYFTITEDQFPGYRSEPTIGCFVEGQSVGYPYEAQQGEAVICNVFNYDEQPTLSVTKRVINDNSGQSYAIDFKMFVNGVRVDDPRKGGGELEDNQVTHAYEGAQSGVEYEVTEENMQGYEASEVSCVDTANNNAVVDHPVTLEFGQSVECTIVNDDIPQGSLTLYKNVVNNWNGPKDAEDFVLTIHDSDGNLVDYQKSGLQIILEAGWYNVGEIQQDGYVTTGWDWWRSNCSLTGWIYVSSGSDNECTITNYDLPGKIVIHKEVVNNNGGEMRAKDFRFKVDRNGSWQNFNRSGVNYVLVDAGWHSVYEDEHYAYRTSYDGCRHIYVKNGETKHCYITNNDRAPEVKVIKWTDPAWSDQDFDFDMHVDGELYESFTIDANRFDDKVPTRYKTSYDFQAGMVEVVESPTEGWDHQWTRCYKETRRGLEYVGHPFNAEIGKDYICKVKNEQRGSVVVTKFRDTQATPEEEGYGIKDENEEVLANWEITLDSVQECEILEVNDSVVAALQRMDNNKGCEESEEVNLQQTTDENGKTVFANLKSGLYQLDEVEQDGWEKRNIYCMSGDKYIGALNDNQSLEFYLKNGMDIECYVGNYQTPAIDITLTPICENDFPFLQWTVKTTNVVPTQFVLDWYTVAGNEANDPADVLAGTQTFTVSEAEFDGVDTYTATTDWLGSDPTVPDWPGWELVNDTWEEDPSDLGGNTRPNARVEFTVNPSDDVEVDYPPATPACDPNPDQPGQVLAATTSATPVVLAETGSGAQSGIIVGLLLIGAVAFTRRRHAIASRN